MTPVFGRGTARHREGPAAQPPQVAGTSGIPVMAVGNFGEFIEFIA
jgi:hypothetical protein